MRTTFNPRNLKVLAVATPTQDLWQFDGRVFTEGEKYNVVRMESDYYYILNSKNIEHLIIKNGWGKYFKIEKI